MKIQYALLTIIGLLFATLSDAQDCAFKENSVDKFTGNVHRVTEKITIAKHIKGKAGNKISEMYFIFRQENDKYFIDLGMKTNDVAVFFTSYGGDKLVFLLKNKQTLEIPATSATPSVKAGTFKNDYWSPFAITSDQLHQLKASRITDIRLAASVNSMDVEIDPEYAADVKYAAACMVVE